MPFTPTPLFAGDFHDAALRLVQDHTSASRAIDPDLGGAWRQMLDLGWQAVLVHEDQGGAGSALSDFAAIVEAVGSQAVTVPLVDRCAVAPSLLSDALPAPQAAALLAGMAAGEASVAPMLHAASQRPLPPPSLDSDGRLQGRSLAFDLSVAATHLVFDTRRAEDGAPVLVLLPAAPLVERARRFVGIDGAVTADVALDGIVVSDEQVLLVGEPARQAIDRAQQLASLLGSVRTVGACGAMIRQTIDYLDTRVQFNERLSTFQALRHRVVDMYVAYENARGLVRDRVLAHGSQADPHEVALTRLYVQDVGRKIAESAIQLHGGMGMTRETPAARLAMHTLMSGLQYGEKADCLDWLVERMADTVAIPTRAAA